MLGVSVEEVELPIFRFISIYYTYGGPYQTRPALHTKAYIVRYFYQQNFVLFAMVPRNSRCSVDGVRCAICSSFFCFVFFFRVGAFFTFLFFAPFGTPDVLPLHDTTISDVTMPVQ